MALNAQTWKRNLQSWLSAHRLRTTRRRSISASAAAIESLEWRTLLSAETGDASLNSAGLEEEDDDDDDKDKDDDDDREIDLVGKFFDAAPETTAAINSVNVSFTVANKEDDTAGTFDVDFYISRDAKITTADRLIGSRTITSLAGESDTGVLSQSLTLPPPGDAFWQGDGTYVIGMIVDGKDVIDEEKERNNANRGDQIDSDAIQVTGTIGAVTGFALIDPQSDTEVSPLATNGIINIDLLPQHNIRADTVPTTVGSVVFTLDGQQVRTENVAPYALFGDNNGDFLPGTLALGPHTLTATPFSGPNGTGAMGTSRTITFEVIRDIDLTGTLFDALPGAMPETTPAINPINVNFTVANIRTVTAGPFDVDFFISRDATITPADRLIGSRTIATLAGNSNTGVLMQSLTLPPPGDAFWQGDGMYWVGMIVDADGVIVETNEANNANRGDQIDSDAIQVTGTIGAVTGFTLIDSQSDTVVSPLANNGVINIDLLPQHNIRADTVPTTVGSVVFTLDGLPVRTENVTPYALFGDNNGDFLPGTLSLGPHTLTATPFSGPNGTGVMGTSRTITFEVIRDIDLTGTLFDALPGAMPETTPAINPINVNFTVANIRTVTAGPFDVDFFISRDATITTADRMIGSRTIASLAGNSNTGVLMQSLTLPPPGDAFWQGDGTYFVGMIVDGNFAIRETNEANNANQGDQIDSDAIQVNGTIGAVTSFTLINAENDTVISPLGNNAFINRGLLPTRQHNIRANTVPMTVGSVVFNLTGPQPQVRIENVAPYALFGDVNGDFTPGTLAPGIHTLTATPFSGPNGTGVMGTPLTITFAVDVPLPLTAAMTNDESKSTSDDNAISVDVDIAGTDSATADGFDTSEAKETDSGDDLNAVTGSDADVTDSPVDDSSLIESGFSSELVSVTTD